MRFNNKRNNRNIDNECTDNCTHNCNTLEHSSNYRPFKKKQAKIKVITTTSAERLQSLVNEFIENTWIINLQFTTSNYESGVIQYTAFIYYTESTYNTSE